MLGTTLSLLLAISAAPTAGQAAPVYRCHGAHGELVLRGTPCAAGRASTTDDAAAPGSAGAVRCPDTVATLRERVQAAFDGDDVNALAGLFLWSGYGARAAYADMARLQRMLARPLASSTLVARAAPRTLPWSSAARGQDLLITVNTPGLDDALERHRFEIVPRDGCYWLRFGSVPGVSPASRSGDARAGVLQ